MAVNQDFVAQDNMASRWGRWWLTMGSLWLVAYQGVMGMPLWVGAQSTADLDTLSATSQQGTLRVGNRTPFPVRVVTLLRSQGGLLNADRAHWDFAPGEGARDGLLLSLGPDPLQVNAGDVLVVYTLDGTGRYWGPFVLGSSDYPAWDGDQQMWLLPLPPEDLAEVADIEPNQVGAAPWPETLRGDPQGRSGPFRAGNRTYHPIRLTILLRTGEYARDPQVVHWDFAPEEGGAEGLPLSVGDELVTLRPGDVILAFTMDGERQYWGPSIVGESLLPFWDPTVGVWSTILQP